MNAAAIRYDALRLLQGKGMILEVARDVSQILEQNKLCAAVIGGVAVVLHGHIRTTTDVDLFVDASLEDVAEALRKRRYVFQRQRREFVKSGIPVHLVDSRHIKTKPTRFIIVDGIRTVNLPDLITMKLQSGTNDVLRAQDLADVIGLIRARKLTSAFAARLHRSVRPDFRTLVKAVKKRGQ